MTQVFTYDDFNAEGGCTVECCFCHKKFSITPDTVSSVGPETIEVDNGKGIFISVDANHFLTHCSECGTSNSVWIR